MSSPLIIAETRSTPHFEFNPQSGFVLFEGKSAPEHVMQFFEPIFGALREYMRTGGPLEVHAKFTYFNTSSSKALLDLFELLSEHHQEYGNVRVFWHHDPDDEDMLESGEEFADDTNLVFEYVVNDGEA
jgi:hypothetical protein